MFKPIPVKHKGAEIKVKQYGTSDFKTLTYASIKYLILVLFTSHLTVESQVKAMVQGRDRRPELGYKMAVECRKKITYPAKNKNSRYNKMPDN